MWWTIGGILGAVGVALGAFGAHGLQNVVTDAKALEWWQTASRYHLFHALAICLVAVHPRAPAAAGVLFAVGIAVFSGSLYAMTLGAPRWFGAITPIGGLCFIAGWVVLAWTGRPS